MSPLEDLWHCAISWLRRRQHVVQLSLVGFGHFHCNLTVIVGMMLHQSPPTKQVLLYKTEYCRNWTELGSPTLINHLDTSRYGKKCRYAHGSTELRNAPRHSRYKTEICRAYHFEGACPYGIRCTYIHDMPFSNYWSKLPIPSSRTDSRFFSRRDSFASSSISSSSSASSTTSSSSTPSSPLLPWSPSFEMTMY
ncbi:hypothetical protein O0I10_001279 [Lichtheimia ornata]|uniref:C3H1-type domain-containing protein n=1 Tax=Lichtheimia ornata TaxID=688661 RepID=A0AAD7Y3I7_9FUNG|nr:uncharacterized protein O0I10_001279 [Lichtheimia ornata]KAJ8663102.1 hypothetical protein O0I10_001279 [Lichtheimia ornata]